MLGPRTHGQMSGPWPGATGRDNYETNNKRPRNNDGQDSDEDKDADLFDHNDESKDPEVK